ncbi:MAG: DUF58 domain-containing protein [bacterium]|nr:DUF58 domain-containing protein [bacterium]
MVMLPDDLIQYVNRIELQSRKVADSVFSGAYSSAFKGRGVEFADVRAYQPGDDVRTIDWNVTARTGMPFVKQFVEERELTLMLVVDVSPSTRFGSGRQTKLEVASHIAGVLGLAAVRSNDRVGLIALDRGIETVVPARKGRRHTLRCVRHILERSSRRVPRTDPRHTDLAGALERLSQVLRRRALVVIVSDFLTGLAPEHLPGSTLERAVQQIARRNDLIVAHLQDQREQRLLRSGLIEVIDLETRRHRLVDTSSQRVRDAFERESSDLERAVSDLTTGAGAQFLPVYTDRAWAEAMVELFRARERRR